MAKEIVIKNSIGRSNFKNVTSETIFSFGKFNVTTNFDNKRSVDHVNKLSSFVAPISLNSLGITKPQSDLIYSSTNEIKLNLEKSDLNKYLRFGSAYDYFRFAIQNIITSFPGSLYVNSHKIIAGNTTYYDFVYDSFTNTSTFKIPASFIDNKFNLVFNSDYTTLFGVNELNNINLSFDKYVIWSSFDSNNAYVLKGFTGYNATTNYVSIAVEGNPFPFTNGSVTGAFDFHIKPNASIFEEFRMGLRDYERYMISERIDKGFRFVIKNPSVNDDGEIEYINSIMIWPTLDGYNIDFGNMMYKQFLEALLNIGNKFDVIKTDLIARFLTTSSLKAYDLTENSKITKLLRIYGYEFDQLRIFIDSLQYVNSISYDKKDNVPDAFVANLANTFGWDYFPVTDENDLMSNLLSTDGIERNLSTDLLPLEIDIEVWRRILINTNYYWKSKGTRDAIKSIFMLIGIPEQFINITEYVYTVDGKINPAEDVLTAIDYPTNSFPYDANGYPQAPLETNAFYFQVSGNTDSGQEYMNVFRQAGFDLYQTVDNKKSWVQSGATTRISESSPSYYQEDSRLVLNTKEVDVGLDIAQAIEIDAFNYAKANNVNIESHFYINLSMDHSSMTTTYTLPYAPEGDVEVRFNGILLSTNRSGDTGTTSYEVDYSLTGNVITLNNAVSGSNDIIEITYIYADGTATGDLLVRYVSTRVSASLDGTYIQLPAAPNGDVQLTVNGIELVNAGNGIDGDFRLNPTDPTQLIILNEVFAEYLIVDPIVQVSFVVVSKNTLNMTNELLYRNTTDNAKIYYDVNIGKYVAMLNTRVANANEVKMLINGISLNPVSDYYLDLVDPYKIVLSVAMPNYSVLSVYYLKSYTIFGIDNVSSLSFLEFIDIAQRKLINAKNRKTITDGRGGWYPTLLKVYLDYLKNGLLPDNDPSHSNGYTFVNLYPFLNKYNAFFNKFIDTLLSPTIILRKSGMIIRNTMFTKQKFAYKRGVYMGKINTYGGTDTSTDFTTNDNLMYLGDDGSIIKKLQPLPTYAWLDNNLTTTTTTTIYPCLSNPMTLVFTSTNATAVDSTDGTATVSVTGGVVPYDYIWSNGQYTLNSVLTGNTATGLSGGTNISIMIADDMGCVITGSTVVGEFTFDADYIVLTYQFNDGIDLDTRTRMETPNIGQISQQQYLGWGIPSGSSITNYPPSGAPILTWGGDNTGNGYEAVLINLTNFKTLYPLEDTIVMDARAFWFSTLGVLPVNVAATLYKGGTMIREADLGSGYNFINTGYTSTLNITSASTIITSVGLERGAKNLSSGEGVATLTYTISTGVGIIDGINTIPPLPL